MRNKSWLSITGQWYKESIFTISMSFVLARALFINGAPLILDLLVIVIIAIGIVALLSIRCPYCHKSPLSKVISSSSFNVWAYKLNTLEECPNCSMRLIPEEPCSDQGNDRSP
jgi:DNA-directed RNA polymerase subunit RPC12/RpoP